MLIFLIYQVYAQGLELAAAIVGFRWMRKSWAPAYRLLVALCCVTVAVETVALYCVLRNIDYTHMYNVWAFVETGTILYIQFREAARAWTKRLLIILLVVLTAGSGVLLIMQPKGTGLNLPLLLLSLFVQLIGTCAALIDLLQNTSDRPLSTQPSFWLNAGMLFYGSIFTIVHTLPIYSDIETGKYYMYFSLVANTFMYGGFIACFVALRREDRRNSADNALTSAA